ncbi:hypothetical protein P3S67_013786 [Capsicum chacoense]
MQDPRKVQLWIEEQGKYLEMMFERTKEIGKDFKVSSSVNDEHPSPSNEPKHSPPNDKSEALEKDLVNLNDRSITDKKAREDHDTDGGDSCVSPPLKGARTEERLRRKVQKLKQEFWLSSSFMSLYSDSQERGSRFQPEKA